jgi:hypothetical protein
MLVSHPFPAASAAFLASSAFRRVASS